MRSRPSSGFPAVFFVVSMTLTACSGTPPSSLSSASTAEVPPASAATASAAPSNKDNKVAITFEEARPVLDAHRSDLPLALGSKTPSEQAAAWPAWVAQHDAEIRARLARGDEDSVVNLWLYGTTFTTVPRATDRDLVAAGATASQLLESRLGDLLRAVATPSDNERLQFVRQLIIGHGIDPATEAGQDQAWRYLAQIRERMNRENRAYIERGASAKGLRDANAAQSSLSTLFRDRGLSSDTTIGANFGVDRALSAMKSRGRLRAREVHRVAVVGPGLDFTDKAEGYDFYPLQTIQPFAVADSLARLQLAAPDLTIATVDLSPRVNAHLSAARRRALAGTQYTMQLPLEPDDAGRQWSPEFVQYWEQFGADVGESVRPLEPPAELSNLRVRAVQVRPSLVRALTPFDLNIVLERLNPATGAAPFDLIIATNVLVYYNPLEQAFALFNISRMLRPGGYFLTNYAVVPVAPLERHASVSVSVYWDRQQHGDTMFGFARR
jgi:SAM-dependent methyltransferase